MIQNDSLWSFFLVEIEEQRCCGKTMGVYFITSFFYHWL